MHCISRYFPNLASKTWNLCSSINVRNYFSHTHTLEKPKIVLYILIFGVWVSRRDVKSFRNEWQTFPEFTLLILSTSTMSLIYICYLHFEMFSYDLLHERVLFQWMGEQTTRCCYWKLITITQPIRPSMFSWSQQPSNQQTT